MSRKVFVTHQLPGDRIRELAQCCDMNVWMGPGLLSHEGLLTELAGCQGLCAC
jgi:glyoxylate reductase